MKREDVLAFMNRRWDLVRARKEAHWIAEGERMTPTETIALADGLRVSAVELIGDGFLGDHDEDLAAVIALKRKVDRADAAARV